MFDEVEARWTSADHNGFVPPTDRRGRDANRKSPCTAPIHEREGDRAVLRGARRGVHMTDSDNSNHANISRRRFLVNATTAVGGLGAILAAVPFAQSMAPSERAKAFGGPVDIDISKIEFGQMIIVPWLGKPIWVLRRSPDMLQRLASDRSLLADPDSQVESQQPAYAQNSLRSLNPEYLIVVGLCTHLGCVPLPRFAPGAESELGKDWPGGFFCPCHGSKFDLAGRVFKNVPAPTNLVVPPHHYLKPTVVEIGVDYREKA